VKDEIIEEARSLDCVEKETKTGLFLVDNGQDGEDAWLDLRENTVNYYVYGKDGITDSETPQEIKKLQRKAKAAENGDQKLGEYA